MYGQNENIDGETNYKKEPNRNYRAENTIAEITNFSRGNQLI